METFLYSWTPWYHNVEGNKIFWVYSVTFIFELVEHVVHLSLCDNIFLLLIYFMCGKAKLSDLMFPLTELSTF